MSEQTYDDAVARERMDHGLCPECGVGPTMHTGLPGSTVCSLREDGVRNRIIFYEHTKKIDRRVRETLSDPGKTVPRRRDLGPDKDEMEALHHWQARALRRAGLLR